MEIELEEKASSPAIVMGTLKLDAGRLNAEVNLDMPKQVWIHLRAVVDAITAEVDAWKTVVEAVPDETLGAMVAERIERDGLPPDAVVEIDEAEAVLYRLRELNKLADEATTQWKAEARARKEYFRWCQRLLATLAAQPADEPYSRRRVDAVMADCPTTVKG